MTFLHLGGGGNVVEINPNAYDTSNSLNQYLDSQLSGRKILEITVRDCIKKGETPIIRIRYEE